MNMVGKSATGQLLLRGPMADRNGKKIYMVVGIIAVDEEEAKLISTDTQFTISQLGLVNPVDMKERMRGMNADNMLTSPIWRT